MMMFHRYRVIIEKQDKSAEFQSLIPRIGKQSLSAAGIATCL